MKFYLSERVGTMTSYTKHATIDCSEYDCPMVLVQVKESLDRLEQRETVEVITEAIPKFQLVLQAWTSETNDRYYHSFTEEKQTHHLIQKAMDEIRKAPVEYPKVITNDELKKMLLDEQSIRIMDVREDIEFMLGHIPTAVNVPLSQFTDNLAGFAKDMTYYVICRTGNRSNYACKYMENLGFQKVYNVIPGMYQWDGPLED